MKRFTYLLLFMLLMTSVFAATPDPGHDASRIGPGSFPAGNFSFGGTLSIGTPTPATRFDGAAFTPNLQIADNGANASVAITRFGNNTSPVRLVFVKSRNGTINAYDPLLMNDEIGRIGFEGAINSTSTVPAAYIRVSVDNTPTSTLLPGRISFYTSGNETANAERMRIDSNGSVGINTTSPSAMLDVNGQIIRISGASTNIGLRLNSAASGHTQWLIGSSGTGGVCGAGGICIRDETNSATRLAIDANGNVGVGATSLSYPLTVALSASAGSISSGGNWNVSLNVEKGLSLGSQSSTNHSVIGTTATDKDILFVGWNGTANAERMRIASNGNVGIGTEPSARFHVLYNDVDDAAIVQVGNAGSNQMDALYLTKSGDAGRSYITWHQGSGAADWRIGMTDGATSGYSLSFYSAANTAATPSSPGMEVLRLTGFTSAGDVLIPNGGVGVGTYALTQTLDVNGSVNVSGSGAKLYAPEICLNGVCSSSWAGGVSTAGGWTNTSTLVSLSTSSNNVSANALYVDNTNGRTGIGTTAPGEKLSVEGSGTANENIVRFNNQGDYSSKIWIRNAGRSAYIGVSGTTADTTAAQILPNGLFMGVTGSPSPVQFFTGTPTATVRMTIDTSGNVGIGTEFPQRALTVIGNISAGNGSYGMARMEFSNATNTATFAASKDGAVAAEIAFRTQNSTGGYGERMRIDADGLVGIGTDNPTNALTVQSTTTRARVTAQSTDASGLGSFLASSSTNNTKLEVIAYGPSAPEAFFGPPSANGSIILSYGNETALLGIGTLTGAPVIIGTNNTERMRITGNGNVAIGAGDAVMASYFATTNFRALTVSNPTVNRASVLELSGTDPSAGVGNGIGVVSFVANDSGTMRQSAAIIGFRDVATTTGGLAFLTLGAGTAADERMRIDSSGRVGIGTATPNDRLVVAGNTIINGTSAVALAINGASGATAGIAMNAASTSREAQIFFQQAGVDRWQMGMGSGTSPNWYVYDHGTTSYALAANYTTGNVGVGTGAPAYKLDVQGTVSAGTTAAGGTLRIEGKAGTSFPWTVKTTTLTGLDFASDNGIGRVVFADNGSVGIGTASPGGRLDVNGSIRTIGGRFSIYNSTGSPMGHLLLASDVGASSPSVNDIYIHSENGIGFTSGGSATTRLFINGSGSIGVGTTSPGAAFDVQTTDAGVGTKTLAGIFGRTGAAVSASTREAGIAFSDASNGPTLTGAITGIRQNSSNDWNGGLGFYVHSGAGGSATAISHLSRAMTITSSGNAGIGTATPTDLLHVRGAGRSSAGNNVLANFESTGSNASINIAHSANGGQIGYANLGSTNNLFYVTTGSGTIGSGLTMDNNGNVGIGITNPLAKLHVASGGSYTYIGSSVTGTTGAGMLVVEVADGVDSAIYAKNYGGGFAANLDGNVTLPATSRLYLDGGSNTYITEHSGDEIRMYTGGTAALILTNSQHAVIQATKRLYLDGGGNTYLYEESGDAVEMIVGGQRATRTTNTYFEIGPAGTAMDFYLSSGISTGTGSNYLCLDTTTWKVLRGNGAACTASSIRFKQNVNNIGYGLAAVRELRPVSYEFKPESNIGDGTKLGFIAEEMYEVIPEVVTLDDNGQPFGLDYPVLTAVLAKSVQELDANDRAIEARIEALETPGRSENAPGRVREQGNDVVILLGGAQQ